MYKLLASIAIAAPRETVFACYCDPGTWQEALPSLVALEMLNDPPFGLGTRWRQRRRLLWMSDESEIEVTAFQPPERIEYQVHNAKLAAEGGTLALADHMAEAEGGTIWSVGVSIRMPQPMPAWVEWLFVAPMRWGARRDLRAFKRYIERRATG